MTRTRRPIDVPARCWLSTVFLLAVLSAGLVPATAGAGEDPVGFGRSDLAGQISERPTSLQFGPDGRLYVAQLDGTINAYSVVREGPNDYEVAAVESIGLVAAIPNHNDDGVPEPEITGRLVTGLLVIGIPAHPVVYVTSSDPTLGDVESGDTGLDTNSGTLSRLRWNGTTWNHRILVRGLPRSEEVHATNGIALDPWTRTLYLAQGGNTNMGAPSAAFAHLPEYALAGAILSVDLDGLGPLPYDLPTLNDRSRPGVPDANDPFGGNDGRNQAKIVPGGPVQVYSPGFRNAYDVLLASNELLYATDNGPNAGAGGLPAGEGPAGTCTDEPSEPGSAAFDSLHVIEGPGEYHGAPNPTRGNTANVWGTQSPVPAANPVECDWLEPGPERGSLATFPESTNGLAEYSASNFGGAMQGDLLAVTLSDSLVYRISLTPEGTAAASVSPLLTSLGKRPLDLTTQADAGPFPGTIWVADHSTGRVLVFEPNDYGGPPPACSGDDDPGLDEDGDGYDNADEIANGTNPCSAGDVPPDADGDFLSDRADPDDDDDGSGDTVDPFALDPDDGRTTALPLSLTWDPGEPEYGGLVESGFTGLMTDLTTDYLDRFDPAAMTVGSATGTLAIDAVGDGTARASANTQRFGLQAGLDVSGGVAFRVRGRIVAPFAGTSPQPGQEIGVAIGTGTQDAYVQVVLTSDGVSVHRERGGTIDRERTRDLALPGPDAVDVMLDVDPAARTVQPRFSIPGGGGSGTVGAPIPIPAGWLDGPEGLAVGLIATSRGPAPAFPAVWDFLKANPTGVAARIRSSGPVERRGTGAWVFRAPTGFPRSEVSYTAVGHRFYLAWGGLLHQFFNPVKNRWRTLASLPQALNHIQAVAFRKKIYSLGGLEMRPGSPSSGTVWIYDPESDSFASGTPMPEGRERGAGGVARHDGLLYYLGGLHDGVAVPWVDVYDPVADTWESLPDMPRARDHFQAAVIGDVLYAIGGRTGNGTTPFGHNDALDLQTGEWTTGLEPLPTPRAGYAVAVLGPEILVIGGEGNGKAYRKVEAYLPSGDSWRTLARMNVPAARDPGGGAQRPGVRGGGGTNPGWGRPDRQTRALHPVGEGARGCPCGCGNTRGPERIVLARGLQPGGRPASPRLFVGSAARQSRTRRDRGISVGAASPAEPPARPASRGRCVPSVFTTLDGTANAERGGSEAQASARRWSSASISSWTFLPTRTPPVSIATFQVMPHSSRSISPLAVNEAVVVPNGSGLTPSKSASSTTSFVTSLIVRSPTSSNVLASLGRTSLDRNVSFGYFSTSRKSGLRRWVSRSVLFVSMLAASISTLTELSSGSSAMLTAPDTLLNRPRIFVRTWRATKAAEVCCGSRSQIPTAGASTSLIWRTVSVLMVWLPPL